MTKTELQLRLENEELRQRLMEAEETLDAIRNGEVDAILVSGPGGEKVFSLASAETPYRIIIEEMNEGVVSLSSDGTILYCNRRFAELVSVPLEQIMGANFTRFVKESERQKYDTLLKDGLISKSSCEITYVINSNNHLHLHLSISPLTPDLIGDVCILISDITELKQKEEELLQSRDILEQRVTERTAELSKTIEEIAASRLVAMQLMEDAVKVKKDLEIANKELGKEITERKLAEQVIKYKNEQLQKLNNEKDKFFSIIAHDLRSPFNSFLGLTQIMAEELPSLTMAQVQDLALDMKNSATNIYSLLENLLKWSQMQRGMISFTPEVIQLQPMIVECLATTIESAKNKGIDISWAIPENTTVFADSDMIQTVIRNLISNAVKFTHQGGKVSLSANVNSYNNVEISISDTGIGMSQTMVDNLFSPDVQTSRKGTAEEPSTGLGLLLCKEFIEKHDGKLRVISEIGKGSLFSFKLPYNAS